MSTWSESSDILSRLAKIVDAAQDQLGEVSQIAKHVTDCESIHDPLARALNALVLAEQGLRDHAFRFADAARESDDNDMDRGML